MEYKGHTLDGFQERAIEALQEGRSVIVAAPTGAGKTVIAEYALEQCLREGRRAIYTAPIKALSNQKYRDFAATWGDRVGILTGDVTLNPDAPVLIMTTEIFRNTIFESPRRLDDLAYAIFDEIHYIDDPERGTVWEESIIFAPEGIRFVYLSATISNLEELSGWIADVRGEDLEVVREEGRPVPLHHRLWIGGRGLGSWAEARAAMEEGRRKAQAERDRRRRGARPKGRKEWQDHVPAMVEEARRQGHLPAIVFAFSRRECENRAQEHAHLDLLEPSERDTILEAFDALARAYEVEDDARVLQMRDFVGRGVAYHHAGLLPTLKEMVERLFTTGGVKLLFTTDTFALGVNMPAKAVAMTSLTKFDGVRRVPLKSREYHQMAGRAGRRGIDTEGNVYALVDPDRDRFDSVKGVVTGRPEHVNSRFSLSYAALLALYGRLGEERLLKACDRSFASWQRRSRSESAYRDMLNQVRSRLAFLRNLRFIEGDGVSAVGVRAALLYGYEVQVAELVRHGVFHRLDAARLAALFSCIVFEEKGKDWYRPLPKRTFGPLRNRVKGIVSALVKRERRFGVRDLMKEPAFGIATATLSWAQGAPFRALEADTSASDGDLVRVFRMTIQLLRQVEHAYPDDDHLVRLLREARRRINRDVVDAERQLRQSVVLVGEDEAEGEPGEAGD